ncbi:hypothetical protein [Natrialba sp. PRR66]|uniref:hypothetical protein n=1 Tax=Natrialba sp. PRR66 TaxID=3098146 RepID=UPI002B1D3859|nr:hypothetical protein [Natrialba sp. PRR66]
MFPRSPSSRLRWAIREALVFAGILLFWIALATVITIVLQLLVLPFELLGLQLGPMSELVSLARGFQDLAVPMTVLTSGLYTLVRAGTVLIDHYRRTSS